MGFFLWGVAFGWGACALYYYNLTDDSDKVVNAAAIIFVMIAIAALVISLSLGAASMPNVAATPTPTMLGR